MERESYKTKAGVSQYRPIVTMDDINGDEYKGFCLACGEEAYGVEPDARRYRCEMCDEMKVYGLEELILMGLAKMWEGEED